MQKGDAEIVRTTIRISKTLWDKVRHRAIEQNTTAEALVSAALTEMLKKGN